MRLLPNPYRDVRSDHPLIVREARRLRWLQGTGSLQHASLLTILLVLAIAFLLYVGWLALYRFRLPYRIDSGWFYGASGDFFFILGGLSLLASLLLDYASFTASLNSISSEINSGTWDLLRLTAVREGELVLAKHAVTQLRVWQTTMRIVGLRIAVGAIVLIMIVGDSLFMSRFYGARSFGENLLLFLFNYLPFAALFGVFILEPLWRMRAMTALGMVISSRVRDGASAALLAIGTVCALWLMQALVVVAVGAGLSVLIFLSAGLRIGALCAPILILLVIFPAVYGFYDVLRTWGLRQVARRVFTMNP